MSRKPLLAKSRPDQTDVQVPRFVLSCGPMRAEQLDFPEYRFWIAKLMTRSPFVVIGRASFSMKTSGPSVSVAQLPVCSLSTQSAIA